MRKEEPVKTATIVLVIALVILGMIVAAVLGVDFETCEDYDTVRVGNTTTQVCDND